MKALRGPEAARLLAALHGAADPDQAWSEAAFARLLAMPGSFAIADGHGFVLARTASDEAEILMLAVVPSARRSGLGRRLVEQAAAEARDRGAKALFLEVAETNAAARALYRGTGFAEVGRRRHYYPDGADALVLRRSITPCGR
jgi:ribosomal-protein-alanine N-acetyltransferase